MSDSLPPAINTLILDLLNKADLDSVTPRILREGLESIQTAQKLAPPADESRHIPHDFDLSAHKKAVNALIKKLYNEVASSNSASSSDVKPSIPDSLPSSQSTPAPTSATSPPPPKTTIPLGGGLALPGLGGVRGSHASPSSSSPSSNGFKNDTSGDAALAAKLQQQQSSSALPTTRGSASNDSTPRPKKRKTKADADEIESDEDSDVEAAAASAASKSRKTTSSSKKSAAKKDKEKKPRAANPNNPFNRPVLLSPAMAEICGSGEMPRHGVVKQLWAYVKERELQNPNNRRQIMCDEKLQNLFGKAVVDSFEMSKLIGAHVKKKEDVVS